MPIPHQDDIPDARGSPATSGGRRASRARRAGPARRGKVGHRTAAPPVMRITASRRVDVARARRVATRQRHAPWHSPPGVARSAASRRGRRAHRSRRRRTGPAASQPAPARSTRCRKHRRGQAIASPTLRMPPRRLRRAARSA